MYSLPRIIVSLLVFFSFHAAFCDNPYIIRGGPGEAGMGSVCIMRPGFWSSFSNQALLAHNRSPGLGFSYENRFSIPELGTATAAIVIPVAQSSMGITYSHFGYPEFRRSAVGAHCGLILSENISAGIGIDYFSEKASGDYESFRSATFEAGLFIRASEKVTAGVHLFNPLPNSLRKTFMPSTLRAGAGIRLNSMLFAGAEVEMTMGQKLILRAGFEYMPAKNISLRGGFCTENTSFSFGPGYMLRWLRIDLSFVTHERLGITSGASLI
ncbi:MAG: hypothetical protein JXA55_06865, partial [Bacteroidales bacterium]|nr:hypothetical protein [Bacteroidales bacterium]